jgi:hypothetical protein
MEYQDINGIRMYENGDFSAAPREEINFVVNQFGPDGPSMSVAYRYGPEKMVEMTFTFQELRRDPMGCIQRFQQYAIDHIEMKISDRSVKSFIGAIQRFFLSNPQWVEIERIDLTEPEDLPLLIGSMETSAGEHYLAKKIKEIE